MNQILIREFTASDLDAALAVFYASVRQGTAAHYSEPQRMAWAPDGVDRESWLEKRLSRPTWLALIGDEIAGITDLVPDGCVNILYVHPDFYRQGVAIALLKKAEAEARQRSISKLFAEVSITARPTFEKAGFTVIKEQTIHYNGQDFINFQMEKPL